MRIGKESSRLWVGPCVRFGTALHFCDFFFDRGGYRCLYAPFFFSFFLPSSSVPGLVFRFHAASSRLVTRVASHRIASKSE